MPHTRSDVAALLPQLRSYARDLTGQQTVEDSYFRICLELIVEDPDRLSQEGPLKGELFRLFRHVWSRANPLAGVGATPARVPQAWWCALQSPELAQSRADASVQQAMRPLDQPADRWAGRCETSADAGAP